MRLALPPDSCKVYTPLPLADAMVAALGDQPHLRWLEPSHGKGAFVEALALRNVDRNRIVAIDLDPAPAPADRFAITLRGTDFLRWAAHTPNRFDRIVGNPPYVAISQLPPSLRRTAAGVTDSCDRPIGNGANVWYAFVLASLRLLVPGGSLAFVLPAAAEFADYSAALRVAVRDQFEKLELFRSERPLFSEVHEGNIVAIARNYRSQPFRIVRRRFSTPRALVEDLLNSRRVKGLACLGNSHHTSNGGVALSSVAKIRLGGVTGDARYFLMNDETRRELRLPKTALIPVVSRAHHLRSAFIGRPEWESLKQEGNRVWLFNPTDAATKHPAVQKYLRRRVSGCNRAAFKIATRTPWYRTPLPQSPHAFLSGMSQFGPWLCINLMPRLNATNTLYIVEFKEASENERYGYALALLTTSARQQLRRAGRRYADGLVKYEPSALAQLHLPVPNGSVHFRLLYKRALRALLGGKPKNAMEIADSGFIR